MALLPAMFVILIASVTTTTYQKILLQTSFVLKFGGVAESITLHLTLLIDINVSYEHTEFSVKFHFLSLFDESVTLLGPSSHNCENYFN